MELKSNQVKRLGKRLDDESVLNRQRVRTQQEYETIYGITPENAGDNIDLIFKRVIQARANPLSKKEYDAIIDTVNPESIIKMDSREEALNELIGTDQIAQKIANEFLRQVVDVFEIRPEWRPDLEVALDTHVIQALVKTGAIQLDDPDRSANDIVNMNPKSNPYKRISYTAIQDSFRDTAAEFDFNPIVFDELWVEHRHFISDDFLQEESVFYDLLENRYRSE
jgi:hypothetical protein